MPGHDWWAWHQPYDDPASPLARRLAVVQRHLRDALDRAPCGTIRAISMCAGQGRDLLGALVDHPRCGDVVARLVELDPRNAHAARAATDDAELYRVETAIGDASTADAYAGAVPADLVLVCGVFGNITSQDVERLVGLLPMLCARDATVVWTRHRLAPDLTPTIRHWFKVHAFREIAFDAPADEDFTVGVHQPSGPPTQLAEHTRLFTFVGYRDLDG